MDPERFRKTDRGVMRIFKKRYQYWWHTGEGYAVEEFETLRELLDLIASYSSTNFCVTEKVDYLSGELKELGDPK